MAASYSARTNVLGLDRSSYLARSPGNKPGTAARTCGRRPIARRRSFLGTEEQYENAVSNSWPMDHHYVSDFTSSHIAARSVLALLPLASSTAEPCSRLDFPSCTVNCGSLLLLARGTAEP
jgi:hypothetical protein